MYSGEYNVFFMLLFDLSVWIYTQSNIKKHFGEYFTILLKVQAVRIIPFLPKETEIGGDSLFSHVIEVKL
jgi:hypothetical protein